MNCKNFSMIGLKTSEEEVRIWTRDLRETIESGPLLLKIFGNKNKLQKSIARHFLAVEILQITN